MSESIILPTHPRFKNLIGRRFGRLVVVAFSGMKQLKLQQKASWFCKCDCGSDTTALAMNLQNAFTQSCGCLCREVSAATGRTHGLTETPEYSSWSGMIQRCENANDTAFKNYGGRGIMICPRWRESFANFYADMGPKPSPQHSIDRINNEGNYEPSNCRWATSREQGSNRRDNRILVFRGETLCLSEWAIRVGLSRQAIYQRLAAGWSVERALTHTTRPG